MFFSFRRNFFYRIASRPISLSKLRLNLFLINSNQIPTYLCNLNWGNTLLRNLIINFYRIGSKRLSKLYRVVQKDKRHFTIDSNFSVMASTKYFCKENRLLTVQSLGTSFTPPSPLLVYVFHICAFKQQLTLFQSLG